MIDVEIQMFGARVLVKAEKQDEYTQQSGLILVESYAPEVIGRVVAIGDDVIEVKPDDVVLFTPQAGREMEFNGVSYLILDEDEILAKWEADQTAI